MQMLKLGSRSTTALGWALEFVVSEWKVITDNCLPSQWKEPWLGPLKDPYGIRKGWVFKYFPLWFETRQHGHAFTPLTWLPEVSRVGGLAGWVSLNKRQDGWVWILRCHHFCISGLCLTQDCKGKLQWVGMTWHFCDICFWLQLNSPRHHTTQGKCIWKISHSHLLRQTIKTDYSELARSTLKPEETSMAIYDELMKFCS